MKVMRIEYGEETGKKTAHGIALRPTVRISRTWMWTYGATTFRGYELVRPGVAW